MTEGDTDIDSWFSLIFKEGEKNWDQGKGESVRGAWGRIRIEGRVEKREGRGESRENKFI